MSQDSSWGVPQRSGREGQVQSQPRSPPTPTWSLVAWPTEELFSAARKGWVT